MKGLPVLGAVFAAEILAFPTALLDGEFIGAVCLLVVAAYAALTLGQANN